MQYVYSIHWFIWGENCNFDPSVTPLYDVHEYGSVVGLCMCINVACRIHVHGSGCGHNIDHNSSSVLSRVFSNLNPFHLIGFELTTISQKNSDIYWWAGKLWFRRTHRLGFIKLEAVDTNLLSWNRSVTIFFFFASWRRNMSNSVMYQRRNAVWQVKLLP